MANTQTKPATKPSKGTVPVQYIAVTGQPTKPYRNGTARQLYHASLVAQCKAAGTAGLPVATLAGVWGNAATAPKLPKSGKVEPVAGWVAYFVRCGVATVTTKHVPASSVQGS